MKWLLIVPLFIAAASAAAEPCFPRVTASSVHAGGFSPERAFDGSRQTRWASAGAGTTQWLAIDFGRPVPMPKVVIH